MPKAKNKQHVPREVMRAILHGGNFASFAEDASPRQERRVRRVARRRGISVNSLLDPSTPPALKQRTRKGIQQEAQRTVGAAFAPALQEIDDQERRAQAVAEKRRVDNEHYMNWLQTQQEQLDAHARASDQQLLDTQRQIAEQSAQATMAMRAEAMGQTERDPSRVSSQDQAKAFDFTPDMKRNAETVANERTRTAQAIGSSERVRQATSASNIAFGASQEAKRQGELWERLGKLGDARQKLKLDQGAEAAKMVAGLLDQEVTKASANRDYNLARVRLGIDQQELAANTALANKKLKQEQREAKAARKERRKDRMLADAQYQLDLDKFGADEAQRRWERRFKTRQQDFDEDQAARENKRDKRGDGDEPDRSGAGKISTLAGDLIDAVHAEGKSIHDNAALHKHMRNQRSGANKHETAFNHVIVQAAAEYARRKKISPQTVKELREIGVYVPKNWRA